MRQRTTNSKSIVNKPQKAPKEQLHAMNLLKIIAILLVFNSHCGKLYPISAMATGGALGNALFFILSGYFVKIGKTSFWPWIKKRIVQLYPPMLIVSVIYAVVFHFYPESVLRFVTRFIWPTGYWFIGGLLLFNVLLYLLEKCGGLNHFVLFSVVTWIVYFAYYILFIDKTVWSVEDHGVFRLIYYFYIYAFGYCIKTKKIRMNLPVRLSTAGTIIFFLSQIGLKAVMAKFPAMMAAQFLCQVLGTLFAIFAIVTALNLEDRCRRLPARLIAGIDYWSRYSLEIYLTQRTAQHIGMLTVFPLNMVVAVAITLVYSVILKRLTSMITGKSASGHNH